MKKSIGMIKKEQVIMKEVTEIKRKHNYMY